MKPLFIFIFFASYIELLCAKGVSSSIPVKLAPCYRRSYTSKLHKPPMNIRLLVELIRIFEHQEKDSLNMRVFTTSLMHSIRYDGVVETPGVAETEFSIPYRASGQPFYKYKLLVDYLISGKPQFIPENVFTTRQLCLLHEIISSRIQVYTHDTHPRICQEGTSYQSTRDLGKYTECYVESGIVDSKWGYISPGHLLAGVAAALQETSLSVQDLLMEIKNDCVEQLNYTQYTGSINNIWIATIAGDLGEVALQQAFQPPKIGSPGIWDNKLLPRIYYLQDKYHDMTSAELLGAIDGAIIANKVNHWISILSRTRFSQLIDMYYSKRGVAYDKSYKACNRKAHLLKLMEEYNLAEQTYKAASILREIGASPRILSPAALLKYSYPVAEEFAKQAEKEIYQHNDCSLETYNVQPLELLLIFDESWKFEQIEILIGLLADAIDVGTYGSSIGIINQKSGHWLTNVTDSIVQLYDEIESNKIAWQLPLRLSKGLGTLVNYLRKKTWTECNSISKVPRATVLLVLANSAVLSGDDLYLSREVSKAAKNDYPETVIMYVTSIINSHSYAALANQYANDVIIETTELHENLIPQIMEVLSKIPNRIMDFSCNTSEVFMEDYVTPEATKIYEIHKEYIKRADFFVTFRGFDYGQASLCIYDTISPHNRECKGLGGNQEISFFPRKYCSNLYNCTIQFSITVTNSNIKCSEFDCRYPDQMRIEITTRTNRSGSTTICYSIYAVVVVLLGICLNIS